MRRAKAKNPKNDNEAFRKRTNDEIQGYTTVRIVGEGIDSREVTLEQARKIADEMGLDLIEINDKGKVPILRIADYEKYIYGLKKNSRKSAQPKTQMKEVHLTANIAKNDMDTKASKARGFIEDGNKVKVILFMRGRELVRREESKKSIYQFISMMEDVSVPESMPKDEGNRAIVILKKKKQS